MACLNSTCGCTISNLIPVVDCGCADVLGASVWVVGSVDVRFGAAVVLVDSTVVVVFSDARVVVSVDIVVIDVFGAVVNAIVVNVVVDCVVVVGIAEIIFCDFAFK